MQIPLGKFFLANKGNILDDQKVIPLHRGTGISFTLADHVDGPFSLEIDHIGFYKRHPSMIENFNYETYVYPKRNYNQT